MAKGYGQHPGTQEKMWNRLIETSAEKTSRAFAGHRFFSPLPFKIQGAFFDCVSVAHHQDRDEAEHAPENNAALFDSVAVHDCPRVHEDDLDIEQDKKHRHHVKLHAEARLAFTLGDHAAFVCGVFGSRALSALAYEHTDNQRGSSEENGYEY